MIDSPIRQPGGEFSRELARIAHVLWCRSMEREGWTYGEVFDEARRTHDCLIPFDRLSRHDQRCACLLIQAQEFEEQLAQVMEHPRGPDREFAPEEMVKGLRVALTRHEGPLSADEIGVIESWDIDPASGDLVLIRVRWPDGELVEHYPALRDLNRVDELSA